MVTRDLRVGGASGGDEPLATLYLAFGRRLGRPVTLIKLVFDDATAAAPHLGDLLRITDLLSVQPTSPPSCTIVCLDMDAERAARLIGRLHGSLSGAGLRYRAGSASFPADGLTLEALQELATLRLTAGGDSSSPLHDELPPYASSAGG